MVRPPGAEQLMGGMFRSVFTHHPPSRVAALTGNLISERYSRRRSECDLTCRIRSASTRPRLRHGVGDDAGLDGAVVVALGVPEVVLLVGGLVDGCGLGPGLVADGDAGALVLAGLVPAGVGPGDDGLGVPAGVVVVLLPGVGGPRICTICRSYCSSRARISARLNELMCWPKARTCFHKAASCVAAEPDGAPGTDRSSWIAIAAVRQLMQL